MLSRPPPYFDLKDYDGVKGQVGRKQSYDDYLRDVSEILQNCYEVAADNCSLWLVMDTVRKNGRLLCLPFDIVGRLEREFGRNTWTLRDVIIWDKYKNTPWHAKGRLKNGFEYILFFTKKRKHKFRTDRVREIADYKKWWLTYPERYNAQGVPPSNVWSFTTPIRGWGNGYQQHVCPIPFPLIERIVALSSDKGDLVIDPFAGSGSVLAIASVMERKAIGFDLSPTSQKQFDSEVLKNAKEYWRRRQEELDTLTVNKRSFGALNRKLRKVKASLELAQASLNGHPHEVKFVALSKGGVRNGMRLLAVYNRKRVARAAYSFSSSKKSDILRLFKIDLDVESVSLSDLIDQLGKTYRLYRYEPRVPHRYVSSTRVSDLFEEEAEEGVYSNIRLSLAKSESVLRAIKSKS